MPLNEALSTALGLTWKVGSQRREAPTQLNLRPLPRWEGSLRSFSRGYVIRCQIRMARLCPILNLAESLVPGGMVLTKTGDMFKEIRLQSVFPLFAFS
jgi:hypothetical protein